MNSEIHEGHLSARFKALIQQEGPLPVEEFMGLCLADPDNGYYRVADPFGAAGDFITAPDISQIFGEIIGLWTAELWMMLDRPAPIQLIELGPGRGTLIADALRAMRIVPDFLQQSSLHLVETSAKLRQLQQETLNKLELPSNLSPQWHNSVSDIAPSPAIIIANEFLDALPIRQFQFVEGQWHERCVGLTPEGALTFTTEENANFDPALMPAGLTPPQEGDIIETCPGPVDLCAQLAARGAEHPMIALFIDYGHMQAGYGDTLQAVRAHQYVNPLETPGQADLTAHVDFATLGAVAARHGLHSYGPISQAHFLLILGLAQRCQNLVENASSPDQARLIASGAQRLVDPEQMGDLFKVMAISNIPNLALPAFISSDPS